MSSSDAPPPETEPALGPEEVSERTFATAFRGFDPVEVRAFLGRIADELRGAQQRETELRQALEDARAVASVEHDVGESAAAEAAAAVANAKEEADRILREAKERVAQLGHAATAESARVLEEARAQAQQITRSKTEESESVAVKKIADAEREAAAIRVKAREDADGILEAAKQRGREMVAEAQAARERMIADINKRKRVAANQLDQLRGGRDRLLESLRVVRRNLDEITTRLEATEGVAPPVAALPETSNGTNTTDTPEPSTGAGAAGGPRPVRTSRVMLGELPPREEARPRSPAAPRIEAPVARAASEPDAAAGASEQAADDPEEIVPTPPTEERKSSALRILRRARPAGRDRSDVTPPQVGRDSPGEGVRIIVPEPAPEAEREPEPEPQPVAVVETDVEVVEPEREPETDPEPAVAEPHQGESEAALQLEAEVVLEALAEDGTTIEVDLREELPDIAPEDLPPPLSPEEVRPRIEDLFARIRADREQAVSKAREVLAATAPADDQAGVEADAGEGPESEPAELRVGTDDADEHRLQARDAVVEPLVAQLTKRLKRTIQDEQNATLDRLRTARPRPDADDVLAAPDTQPAPYRYAALPLLEEAARAAAAAAPFGAVGVGVDDLAQALAEDLSAQIRAKVDRVLADSASEDVDLTATSERVSAVYREWKTQRIERLAMHHLIAAWSRGTFVATPEGTLMRWVVDDDGPCPDCDDNVLAGPTPRGAPFPTGQLHPPAHPGCRCLLTPADG